MGRSVRKKCVLCKRVMAGAPGKWERCDSCGSEVRPIPYANRRKARVNRG